MVAFTASLRDPLQRTDGCAVPYYKDTFKHPPCNVIMLIYHIDWMLRDAASSPWRPAGTSSCTSCLLHQGGMLNNSSPV